MRIEKGNDDVDDRFFDVSDIDSSTLCSVVAAADERVDAALAATNDADDGDSVRFVELVVLINDDSCLFTCGTSVARNEGT